MLGRLRLVRQEVAFHPSTRIGARDDAVEDSSYDLYEIVSSRQRSVLPWMRRDQRRGLADWRAIEAVEVAQECPRPRRWDLVEVTR